MPDLGWSEILALVVIAIVFVGPRELPGLMRQIARFTKAARHAAQEFRDALDEIAHEAEGEERSARPNRLDFDTPGTIADPTTGRGTPRRSLLPEQGLGYAPPEEPEEPGEDAAAGPPRSEKP